MVNKPLLRPYFCRGGGTLGGGRLTSHDNDLPMTAKSYIVDPSPQPVNTGQMKV